MRKYFYSLLFLVITFSCRAQIPNLQLLGHLPFTTSTAGVWHYVDSIGNEYALVGAGNGIAIVDVTNPASPNLLFTVPAANSLWRELKTYGHYCYAGTEGGGGITIIDLSGLPASYQSKVYNGDGAIAGTLSSSHTVQVFDDYLYIFGSNIASGGAIMCSLADPWNPTYAGMFNGNYVHDGYVLNDTLYAAEIYAGQFSVVDVTNKANPVTIATQATPLAFNHNTWFSDNHKYLYTTDELNNAPVGVFDISDLQNIQLVETFFNDSLPNEEVHNVRVINDFLVNPSYGSQITIVDGARPENLIEIARYPTGTFLCWDASPYLPSGNIIVTDTYGGLYIFAPYYVRACYLEGNVTDLNTGLPINDVQVKILSTTMQAKSKLNGDYKTGNATAGTFDVEFSKGGYDTKTISGVTISNGNLTTLNVQLEPFSVNGQVIDAYSLLPVPNAHIKIQNNNTDMEVIADAGGNFVLNSLVSGQYDITAAKWAYRSECMNVTIGGGPQIVIPIEPGIYDDFTFDFGWTVTGNATSGIWTRGEPIGTLYTSVQANPEFDVANDCSDRCFMTGNGGGTANTDDVDDGTTILTSPVFGASGFLNPYLNYSSWFFEQPSGNPAAQDTMYISLSNGISTALVEAITGTSNNSVWVDKSFKITDYIIPTAQMHVIISISDKPGTGNPLEGGFDKFQIVDGPVGIDQISTEAITISGYPNPFENQLQIKVSGTQNEFINSEIRITDLSGKIIYMDKFTGSKIINTTDWSAGSYLVYVAGDKKQSHPLKVTKANNH